MPGDRRKLRRTAASRGRGQAALQMLRGLVYPIILGLDRLETASFLRGNGALQHLPA